MSPLEAEQKKKALADYKYLLVHDVTYDGWNKETAQERAFYIRGYTWYRNNVLEKIGINITDCKQFIPDQADIISGRESWHDGLFDWKKPLAPNQLLEAVSKKKRKPIKFEKAVACLVVFEAMAKRLPGFDAQDVYGHMRIEAAVSYINDFNMNTLDTIRSRDSDFLENLKKSTEQRSKAVFNDMAGRKTVTHKLAVRVQEFIREKYKDSEIGDVDCRYNQKVTFTPSDEEEVGF